MPRFSNKQEAIDHLKKGFGRQLNVSYYLMSLHGAGIVGSLEIFTGYVKKPQFDDVGLFLIICGVGFIAALIGCVTMSMLRALVVKALTSDQPLPEEPPGNSLFIAFVIAIVVSLGSLTYAAVVLASHLQFV
jgi:hypothetical protein